MHDTKKKKRNFKTAHQTGGRWIGKTGGRLIGKTGGRLIGKTGGRWIGKTGGRWIGKNGGRLKGRRIFLSLGTLQPTWGGENV